MPLLGPGDVVSHWRVDALVGRGGGAEVYACTDTRDGSKHALKLEKRAGAGVAAEARCLCDLAAVDRVLRLTGGAGTDRAGRAFFVAELLAADNLAQAARRAGATPVRPVAGDVAMPDAHAACDPAARWRADDARAAARDTLAALQSLHAAGWLHRDVKPSNFGWRDGDGWTLFDMGLAARGPVAASPHAPGPAKLLGSATYASLAAHEGRSTGRRDDAWSWLFIVAEQWAGTLPWRATPDRAAAAAAKRAVLADPAALAPAGAPPLPAGLAKAAAHLASLGVRDAPDYELLRECVADVPTPLRCAEAAAADAAAEAAARAADAAKKAAADAAAATAAAAAPTPPQPAAARAATAAEQGAAGASGGRGHSKKRRRQNKPPPRAAHHHPPRRPHHRPWRPPPAPAGFLPAGGGLPPPPPHPPRPPPPPPHGWTPRW